MKTDSSKGNDEKKSEEEKEKSPKAISGRKVKSKLKFKSGTQVCGGFEP